MARIKNDIFKLTGSLGGLTFSQDEQGTIVKMKGEVSKKKLSKRTQQSNMEMGGASQAAKVLRVGFLRHGKELGDRYFWGRLNGLMRKVVALGSGKPGERKLDLRKHGGLLEEFEFINARPLVYSVGGIKDKPILNAGRNEVQWTSPPLNRKEQITSPKGATHLKFILLAATVSHYEYSNTKNAYLPLKTKFRPCSKLTESEPIALNQKTLGPITLKLTLTETEALPEEVAMVCAVGVAFFRNVNGELLKIKDAGGMRVLGVG
ncbi:MAG TPA: hypothetical protein DC015_12670 [Aequorivita sp.]|nr:hypothetical protein [Aequorivita sp.]